MKYFLNYLVLLIFIFVVTDLKCQGADPLCVTTTLSINTGLNHINNLNYGVSSSDQYWTVTHSPPSFLTTPFHSSVINPNSNWGVFPNSSWITSNYLSVDSALLNVHPFEFETCFCVGEDNTDVNIDFELLSFGNAIIDLVSFSDDLLIQNLGTNIGFPNNESNPYQNAANINLDAGSYCIKTSVFAVNKNLPFGFNLIGNINGVSLIERNCCNANYECLPNICLNNNEIPNNLYIADTKIKANGNIALLDTVRFLAGDTISLNPGFSSLESSMLDVFIHDCDTFSIANYCDLPAPEILTFTGFTGNEVNLMWNNVLNATDYLVQYTVEDSIVIGDFFTPNNMISIPIMMGVDNHQFTVFTLCAPQIGNPQGPTIEFQNPNLALISQTCLPPTGLEVLIEDGFLELTWDQNANGVSDFNLVILADGQPVFESENFLFNSLLYQIPTIDMVNTFEVFLANNCTDPTSPNDIIISFFAVETIVTVVDIPDAIYKICTNKEKPNVVYDVLGMSKVETFSCSHYKNITHAQYIDCHCQPKKAKPRYKLPTNCPE